MNEDELRRALDLLTDGSAVVGTEEGVLPSEGAKLRRQSIRFRERAHAWMSSRNIQALGLGLRQTCGDNTDALALRVYVAKKRPRAALEAIVPSVLHVPAIGDVPTDVIEIGDLRLQSFRGRARPASPGVGIGHANVTAGTLGCIVRGRSEGTQLFALGNSHILADSGRASIGDPVYQPAPADAETTTQNRLGKLSRFVPFEFSADGYPNRVDAAIAAVADSKVRREVRLLGVRPTALATTLVRGMRVQKVGRTSDLTHATIEDVDLKVSARYPTASGGKRRAGFAKQVGCTAFTSDGDSGAAVLTEDGELAGLHFMGSDGLSVFNPIAFVFDALELELA